MAINRNDLIISSQSYTNKDFDSVYTELLTLAKNISSRFDFINSAETDPFIIMLKLMAFCTDKLNYNVDKNILERFMPSATQETSMNELTSRWGYNMHYYKSARGTVSFKYAFPTGSSRQNITIEQWAELKSDDDSTSFVTITGATMTGTESGGVQQIDLEVIEGTHKQLTVLDNSTNITLENLDENNRIYFSERMVAQNGVFIHGGNADSKFLLENSFWESVTNLNTQTYGSPCFVFRYDSIKQLPYVEFPEWINEIIGPGLTIDYVVSTGINGNVIANAISKFVSDISATEASTDELMIFNSDALLNGQNPETIDEAYSGFKKKIGTFDTLVTCRDYANGIYNLLKDDGNPYVSNIQVGDRRNDPNYSYNVIEFTEYGSIIKSETKSSVEAFDLFLYPLAPLPLETFTDTDQLKYYVKGYRRLTDTAAIISDTGPLADIKTMCHNFRKAQKDDTVTIKNIYSLDCLISTTEKVDIYAQKEIIEKVKCALATNFNSRTLDYGYEIPYEKLEEVIENADSRIRYISLLEPVQTPVAMVKMDNKENIEDEEQAIKATSNQPNNWYKNLVMKNIFAGRVSLFDYDERFLYNYGQTDKNIIENVSNITSHLGEITIPNDSSTVTLNQNEVVQFISPSYLDDKTYVYAVNYLYDGTNVATNKIYKLTNKDTLSFKYTDSNNVSQIANYTDGTIIQPSFDLSKTVYKDNGALKYTELGQTEQITTKKLNQEQLKETKKCYWYLNNKENKIPWQTDGTYVLQDNEYFFYSDVNLTSLYSFGSGTKLTCPNYATTAINLNVPADKVTDLGTVLLQGLTSLESYFKVCQFENTDDDSLKITEQTVLTLSEGDSLQVTEEREPLTIPDNKFNFSASFSGAGINYYIKGNDSAVALGQVEGNWTCRGLLDINAGPELEQTLINNQSIILGINGSDEKQPITTGYNLLTSSTEPEGWLNSSITFNNSVLSSASIENSSNFYNNLLGGNISNESSYYSINYSNPNWSVYINGSTEPFATKYASEGLTDWGLNYSMKEGIEDLQGAYINITTPFNYHNYYKRPAEKFIHLEKWEAYTNNTFYSKTENIANTFKLNALTQKPGGENIDVYYTDLNNNSVFPSLYNYRKVSSDSGNYASSIDNNHYRVNFTNNSSTLHLPGTNSTSYIMAYFSGINNTTESIQNVSISITNGSGGYIKTFNNYSEYNSSTTPTSKIIDSDGMYIFEMNNTNSITFNRSNIPEDQTISVTVSKPRLVNNPSLNPLLDLGNSSQSDSYTVKTFAEYMNNSNQEAYEKFYATSFIDDTKAIELSNTIKLSNPEAFYDYNNVLNQWTIPEIDFENSNISIARGSKK